LSSIIKTSGGQFAFKNPPYEYEQIKMPFDILAGDDQLRIALKEKTPLDQITSIWKKSYTEFNDLFSEISHYPETL
jgi:uncharacterized protein YbbC (DUF1343 family)